MENNIYKEGLKKKVRFEFKKGLINIEDLWDLSLEDINEIYKNQKKKLDNESEDSLFENKENKVMKEIKLKIEILKDVFETRTEAARAEAEKAIKAAQKQKYLEAREEKEKEEIKNLTKEELDKKISEL